MASTDGIRLPEADVLSSFAEGKFVLSNLAAKRAKQLKEGAPPLIRTESNHPLTIAMAEIAAGKIKPVLPTEELERTPLDVDVDLHLDGPRPAELGMLLPGLDDVEVELVATLDEGDDHEEELAADSAAGSLLDILGDDAEEDVVAPESDDTMSLNELADQEEGAEEGESEV